MKTYKRVFAIVVDSLGVGAAPNAKAYGDEGCDTLGHIAMHMENFHIPNLAKLGLANLHPMPVSYTHLILGRDGNREFVMHICDTYKQQLFDYHTIVMNHKKTR